MKVELAEFQEDPETGGLVVGCCLPQRERSSEELHTISACETSRSVRHHVYVSAREFERYQAPLHNGNRAVGCGKDRRLVAPRHTDRLAGARPIDLVEQHTFDFFSRQIAQATSTCSRLVVGVKPPCLG